MDENIRYVTYLTFERLDSVVQHFDILTTDLVT